MARNIDNLSILDYCARSMLPQIACLRKTAQNALRRKNTEDIHDLRVASRRIRTCLSLFADYLPSRKSKPWVRDIKAITQSYGRVRDLDVQIDLLNELYKTTQDKSLLAGIRRVKLRLRQKRENQESETRTLTAAILESPTLLEMQAWAESIIATPNSRTEKTIKLFQTAYSQIQSRLDEFLFYEVFIFDPERINELHQMRIAAKHLRYTLEIFSELYSGKIDFALDIARKTQQILGEIHDADVWSISLPRFLNREQDRVSHFYGFSSPFNRLKPGINFLLENRRIERERLYNQFLIDWKKWKMKETWLNLRKIIFLTSLEQQKNNLATSTNEGGEIQNPS
ncbi:MAG: CHAD domain-containing protein [Pelolinea sp.]|nr:CHAD domain-containing protein [Pelolinea sp.]